MLPTLRFEGWIRQAEMGARWRWGSLSSAEAAHPRGGVQGEAGQDWLGKVVGAEVMGDPCKDGGPLSPSGLQVR